MDPETGDELFNLETGTNGAMAPGIIVEDGIAYSLGGQTKNRAHAFRLSGSEEPELLWARPQGSYVTTPLFFAGHLYWIDKGVAHCMAAESGDLVYRERLDGDFYASLVRAGDAIYAVSRTDGTYVYAASPEFELYAHNRIESDESRFQGTPALSVGRIYLRSDRYLYCIGEGG